MFGIYRKETGKTNLVVTAVRYTLRDAKAKLLADFAARNVKQGTESTTSGNFYHIENDKYIETKITVTKEPDGFILSGATTVTKESVAEYKIIEITHEIKRECVDHYRPTYLKISDGPQKQEFKIKRDFIIPRIVNKNVLKDFPPEQLTKLPVGTILYAQDGEGMYYLAKIISAYDPRYRIYRVHYDGWNAHNNEWRSANSNNFKMLRFPEEVEDYRDKETNELYFDDVNDYNEMLKKGLLLSKDDYSKLKIGDYIDYYGNIDLQPSKWMQLRIKDKVGDKIMLDKGDGKLFWHPFDTRLAKAGTFTN